MCSLEGLRTAGPSGSCLLTPTALLTALQDEMAAKQAAICGSALLEGEPVCRQMFPEEGYSPESTRCAVALANNGLLTAVIGAVQQMNTSTDESSSWLVGGRHRPVCMSRCIACSQSSIYQVQQYRLAGFLAIANTVLVSTSALCRASTSRLYWRWRVYKMPFKLWRSLQTK